MQTEQIETVRLNCKCLLLHACDHDGPLFPHVDMAMRIADETGVFIIPLQRDADTIAKAIEELKYIELGMTMEVEFSPDADSDEAMVPDIWRKSGIPSYIIITLLITFQRAHYHCTHIWSS